ncbi:MAG: DUF3429 domain-containing protein [Pseudomonadota bacterium]
MTVENPSPGAARPGLPSPLPGVPAAAAWLGLSGLIPFLGGAVALALLDGPAGRLAQDLVAGYGAVILSFMGGCRWGFVAAGVGAAGAETAGGDADSAAEGSDETRETWLRYALSVVPALYAWPVLVMADPARPALLGVGFLLLLAADVRLARRGGAPAWWPTLRWPLSLGAAGAMFAAAALA